MLKILFKIYTYLKKYILNTLRKADKKLVGIVKLNKIIMGENQVNGFES